MERRGFLPNLPKGRRDFVSNNRVLLVLGLRVLSYTSVKKLFVLPQRILTDFWVS